MKKWKYEVQVVNDDKWYGNNLRFEGRREALEAAARKAYNWTQVRSTRVVEEKDDECPMCGQERARTQ